MLINNSNSRVRRLNNRQQKKHLVGKHGYTAVFYNLVFAKPVSQESIIAEDGLYDVLSAIADIHGGFIVEDTPERIELDGVDHRVAVTFMFGLANSVASKRHATVIAGLILAKYQAAVLKMRIGGDALYNPLPEVKLTKAGSFNQSPHRDVIFSHESTVTFTISDFKPKG